MVQTLAERFEIQRGRIAALLVRGVQPNGATRQGAPATRISARHFVLAAGAINGPALLLRSDAPDPQQRLGRRTFLHPVVLSSAAFVQRVAGWQGAPQTIYSDHFLHIAPIDGPIGYKLEVPPLHPLIFTTSVPGFGRESAAKFAQFPNRHAMLALMRDGFHARSSGGRVRLRSDGSPELDYPLNEFVMDGARRALLTMAELQFAAGAKEVFTGHEMAPAYTSWASARDGIARLPMEPHLTKVVSAHVMGGCGMASDAGRGVVRPDGVHWQIDNLSVHDGSIFPTSIGANPQLSIYGLVNKLATELARRLTGRDVALLPAAA
jgi:choline dehydrogenase-like flavoprotein